MALAAKKITHLGRPAFKFKFTVTLEYLDVHLKNNWRPKCLQVTWSRGQRKREFSVAKESVKYTKTENEIPVEIAAVSWQNPSSSTLLVTLYKGSEVSDFKRKEYVFVLEDNLGLTRRKLAMFPLDMSEYATMDNKSQPLEMEFKPLSKKVLSVTAGLQIHCEFVNKGDSSDDDMTSNFSHISDDDDEFRRMAVALDEDVNLGFEFSCALQQQHSNLGILQSRALQTKSQLLLDLNIAEKSSLTLMRGSDGATSPQAYTSENANLERGAKEDSSRANHKVAMRVLSKDNLNTKKASTDLRKRVSALYDDRDTEEERKTAKGNIFSTLKSGVLSVFQGRKDSITSPTTSFAFDYSDDGLKSASLPAFHHSSNNNDKAQEEEEYRTFNLKIIDLEEKNQELCLKCGNLEKENGSLRRDANELQAEVGELQLLVEDLRNRLVDAESSKRGSHIEQNKMFEQMNLSGWLCKRGIKGGPIGRRWRRRWFSMDTNGYLYYYKGNNNETPRGFVALDYILIVEDVLPLYQDKNNASFSVITEGRVYELMARDEDEKGRWINALDLIRSWRAQMASVNL